MPKHKPHSIAPGHEIHSTNYTDKDGNPAGGKLEMLHHGETMQVIIWQDGPAGPPPGDPGLVNGWWVEDVIQGLIARLQFFQESRFADTRNAEAIHHLGEAYDALMERRSDRIARGVLGQHKE